MHKIKKHYLINPAALIIGMLVCGLLSVSFGKELQWDLAGYHFYNPFAFLNHRMNTMDYWPPSAIQVYITPTLDFISYYLIQHCTPKMTEFMLGCLHGINAALVFYISRFFLAFFIRDFRWQTGMAITSAVIGLYAPTVLPGIGAFFNDNTVSIFILGFILWWACIFKKYFASRSLSKIQITCASILLGIAAGSKLTEGIYVAGFLAGFILLPMPLRDKLTFFICSISGIVAGFILANGYWMWLLWDNFQNPFFPLFNGIFHSPYFPYLNWSEPRYLPRGIIESLLFPFYFSAGRKPTAELYFTDFRFALVYVLFTLYFLAILDKRKRSELKNYTLWWLYLFFIFSYIAWQTCFSIMRYLGVLQMLAPLVCMLLVLQLVKGFTDRLFSLLAIIVFIPNTMHPIRMERIQEFGSDYFNVKLPAFVARQQSATVLLAYSFFAKTPNPKPNHYLIPFFPSGWHFTGIPFYRYQYEIPPRVRSFVQQGPQPVYLLSASNYMPSMYAAAKELHLMPAGPCGKITSDRQRLTHETILLCPVQAAS
jgi:hypothetical protein